MKTQINYLKVLFLSLVFLFSPFLHANPTNEGCAVGFYECANCRYHGPLITEGYYDYCGGCGIWFLGDVYVAPPGFCYCSVIDVFVLHDFHDNCSCGHTSY